MIQIKWVQIKEDVDKQTWRIAKARIEDVELRNDAQEDGSTGSKKLIMRWAESGIAMVATAIREVTSHTTTSVATDELNMSKVQWTFSLKDSADVDENVLAMLIHKFVVEYILYRWALIWVPKEANLYKESYTKTLSDLVESAFTLSAPTKDKRSYSNDEYEMEVSYE